MSHGFMLALALIGANGDSAEKLVEAIGEFGQSHLAKALSLLDEAEQGTSEPKMLAKIYRQRGIIFEVQQQRLEAIVAFNTALWHDADLKLSGTEHRGQVASLFACANQLFEAGEREVSIRSRYGTELQNTDWKCPAEKKAVPPDISASPPPPPPAIIAAATPADEGGIGIPFWIAAGAAVAAAGAGAGLGATAMSRANDGDTATDPQAMATGATVSFGVAGAAAATAVVLLIIDLM